jgi:hypothetical protein
MVGYPYERGFGLKIAKTTRKESDGVGVGQFKRKDVKG